MDIYGFPFSIHSIFIRNDGEEDGDHLPPPLIASRTLNARHLFLGFLTLYGGLSSASSWCGYGSGY